MAEHPEQPEVSEEGVERAKRAYFEAPGNPSRQIVSHAFRAALNAAAPSIREQERERVREALLSEAAKHRDRTRLRVFTVAALDSLEEE